MVLTSDNEGMPVSLIEAAAVGVAAVTTRVGSAPEVVLDGLTGIVTSTDTDELVSATARLLDDDALRARFGAAARDYAATCFGPQRLVDDVANLYEEVARGVPRLTDSRRMPDLGKNTVFQHSDSLWCS